jgi:hypothetical protein
LRLETKEDKMGVKMTGKNREKSWCGWFHHRCGNEWFASGKLLGSGGGECPCRVAATTGLEQWHWAMHDLEPEDSPRTISNERPHLYSCGLKGRWSFGSALRASRDTFPNLCRRLEKARNGR